MWGPACLFWALLWATWGAPSGTVCPERCECTPLEGERRFEARCPSLDFLGKLRPKQITEIVSLDLSGQSIKQIDHKLKRLRNLKKLDLSDNAIADLRSFPNLPYLTHLNLKGNHIKHVNFHGLPKSVEYLDVSFNHIVEIRVLSKSLPNLKEVNLNHNYLFCDCDFLKVRDLFLEKGVRITRPSACYLPENVQGKSSLLVYCAGGNVMYDDDMIRDEAGSGDGGLMTYEESKNHEDEVENEFIPAGQSLLVPLENLEYVEGSGSEDVYSDYGSGEFETTTMTSPVPILPDAKVRNCFFNCSTPAPSQNNDSSGPPPNILKEIFNGIYGITEEPHTTTSETPTTHTTTPVPIVEEIETKRIPFVKAINKENYSDAETNDTDKSKNVVKVGGDPKELEKQTPEPDKAHITLIVVAVLIILSVGIVVFALIRKCSKKNTNNRRMSENHGDGKPEPVEMKPLVRARSPPIETNNRHEKAPLMNGQNGTHGRKEVEEPEVFVDDREPFGNDVDLPEADDSDTSPIRDDGLLTPETKRVTIQAMELSSPKTPVFVHRHLSDDGRIITTPSLEQRN